MLPVQQWGSVCAAWRVRVAVRCERQNKSALGTGTGFRARDCLHARFPLLTRVSLIASPCSRVFPWSFCIASPCSSVFPWSFCINLIVGSGLHTCRCGCAGKELQRRRKVEEMKRHQVGIMHLPSDQLTALVYSLPTVIEKCCIEK